MVTLFKAQTPNTDEGYTSKQEIDTRIPPKAKPVFDEISVNGVAIAESDILIEAQNHPADNPGEALKEAARALVVRELLWQEAQRLSLTEETETEVDGVLHTPVDVAIDRLMEHEINLPEATDEDCRRIYDRSPERFSSDAIIEARHILLAADPRDKTARDDAKSLAEIVLTTLKKDPSYFAELAKQHSACPSAQHGGNLGQLTRGSTVPEFENVLKLASAPGLLETLVETRYGYHIVEIIHIIPGDILPFEVVKERISAWLEASSWSRAVSQYISILASKAEITGIHIMPADGPLVQ